MLSLAAPPRLMSALRHSPTVFAHFGCFSPRSQSPTSNSVACDTTLTPHAHRNAPWRKRERGFFSREASQNVAGGPEVVARNCRASVIRGKTTRAFCALAKIHWANVGALTVLFVAALAAGGLI